MREILFRGKDIRDIWHIGLLAHIGNAWYISNKAGIATAFEVIPKTIGQYTGLTDKNGVKIFEGDILRVISSVRGRLVDNALFCKSEKREDYAVVLQDYKTGGYKLKVYHKGKYKRIAKFATGHLLVYEAEIIGNIHDNPELLKGENDE